MNGLNSYHMKLHFDTIYREDRLQKTFEAYFSWNMIHFHLFAYMTYLSYVLAFPDIRSLNCLLFICCFICFFGELLWFLAIGLQHFVPSFMLSFIDFRCFGWISNSSIGVPVHLVMKMSSLWMKVKTWLKGHLQQMLYFNSVTSQPVQLIIIGILYLSWNYVDLFSSVDAFNPIVEFVSCRWGHL